MLGSSAHTLTKLVRRGLEGSVDNERLQAQIMAYENSPYEIPSWAIIPLMVTILLSGLIIITTRYTNWEVISTIAMIESPKTTILVKTEKPLSEKSDALIEDLVDAEVIAVKELPVTHTVASAKRYFRAKAGPLFRFRGFSFFVVYHFLHFFVHRAFMTLIGRISGNLEFVAREARFDDPNAMMVDMFIFAGTSVLLAPLAMVFTHIVITLPQGKRLSRQSFKFSKIRKSHLLAATLSQAIIKRFTLTIPVFLFKGLGLSDIKEIADENVRVVAFGAFAVLTFTMLYSYLLLRATIMLVRVQASLLPEDAETIVPFDRTFGGKVVSEADGGNGRLSMAAARPDNATVFRMIKLFARMVLIDIKLHILAGLAIVGVAFATLGPALKPLMVSLHAQLTDRTLPVKI